MRIENHPILGPKAKTPEITITVDEQEVRAIEGEPIAAALIAAGITTFHRTQKFNEPRGVFCAIGRCNDCIMTVDGVPNVRTCVTPARPGMKIQTQIGNGKI